MSLSLRVPPSLSAATRRSCASRACRQAPRRLSSPFLSSSGGGGGGGGSASGAGARRAATARPARATPALSHLFGLHARSIDALAEPSYLVDQVLRSSGRLSRRRAALGGGAQLGRRQAATWGGSQRTPRVPRGGLYRRGRRGVGHGNRHRHRGAWRAQARRARARPDSDDRAVPQTCLSDAPGAPEGVFTLTAMSTTAAHRCRRASARPRCWRR